MQLILCRSMAETLMVLGILLLLRHLPGIHIGSLAAYTFALFWGGTGLTMRLWGRMEAAKSRIGNPNQNNGKELASQLLLFVHKKSGCVER